MRHFVREQSRTEGNLLKQVHARIVSIRSASAVNGCMSGCMERGPSSRCTWPSRRFCSFREDRHTETEFVTVSYWESVEAMSRFTGRDPTRIHHLPRDLEFLIELPERVQILKICASHGNTGGDVGDRRSG